MIQQPGSLCEICCAYIGQHFHLVDSLLGVPSHLGYRIFREFVDMNLMNKSNFMPSHLKSLNILAQSFPNDVLHSADFKMRPLILQEFIPLLPVCNIVELKLDACDLTDDNTILQYLGSFSKLKILSLRKNWLTSEGMRTITAAYRFRKQGCLENVDLSGNPYLKESALNYLLKVDTILVINLSDTSVSLPLCRNIIKKCSSSWRISSDMDEYDDKEIHNQGWFSLILSNIADNDLATATPKRRVSSNQRKFLSFDIVVDCLILMRENVECGCSDERPIKRVKLIDHLNDESQTFHSNIAQQYR